MHEILRTLLIISQVGVNFELLGLAFLSMALSKFEMAIICWGSDPFGPSLPERRLPFKVPIRKAFRIYFVRSYE
jgi:hypothetical protein